MTASVAIRHFALLVLAAAVVTGCLPSAPKEEEKEPHFLAGRSRVNTMDYKGAIESFEKALEVNPKSGLAHFELGWLFDQKEPDPAAAIYHYESYLKLCPNSGKEEMVKTRILACKQQLTQAVSLAPGFEKQQRELEQLAEENKRLRDELERYRALAATNQAAAASSAARRPVVAPLAPPSQNTASPARVTRTPTAASRTHTVKSGETAMLIARRYGVKLEALLSANPRVDPRRMHVGQALVIPGP